MSEPDEWISASEALAMGQNKEEFSQAIIQRAEHGLVRAKARNFISFGENGKKQEDDYDVPPWFWGRYLGEPNWGSGDFRTFDLGPLADQWSDEYSAPFWHALGVTFARSDIQNIPGCADAARPKAAQSVGGRPSKADWEAVMIEMARQLYVGDLEPKFQADIEKAISCFLSCQGIEVGESTVREHARPLWKAIQR